MSRITPEPEWPKRKSQLRGTLKSNIGRPMKCHLNLLPSGLLTAVSTSLLLWGVSCSPTGAPPVDRGAASVPDSTPRTWCRRLEVTNRAESRVYNKLGRTARTGLARRIGTPKGSPGCTDLGDWKLRGTVGQLVLRQHRNSPHVSDNLCRPFSSAPGSVFRSQHTRWGQ